MDWCGALTWFFVIVVLSQCVSFSIHHTYGWSDLTGYLVVGAIRKVVVEEIKKVKEEREGFSYNEFAEATLVIYGAAIGFSI